VNQGGKRKGAVCGYLETWHIDIEESLDLRKKTPAMTGDALMT
jgi:ribonucleoside-diphosphate reductase alpha chain